MPVPSILEYEALRRLIGADLEQRLAAVEAQLRGEGAPPQPEPLKARNAERVAEGERLREAISVIVRAHPGRPRLSAKHVLRSLTSTQAWDGPLPSVRTVQRHMDALRQSDTPPRGASID